MNTLDRMVRIIYKELDLREYINIRKGGPRQDRSLNSYMLDRLKRFKLSDPLVKKRIRSKYLEIYSENYNPDELDVMLDWLEDELADNNFDNYLGIFPYVVKRLIKIKNGQLMVEFPDYLEWHGFINKADYNIFYAAYLAQVNIANHRHRNFILHDNNSIYQRLRFGIAENHMHIKGSGYTTDMNWYEFIKERPYDERSLEKFLSDDYLKCDDYRLSFNKIKLVRLYLYSHVREDFMGEELVPGKKFSDKLMMAFLGADSMESLAILYMRNRSVDQDFKLDSLNLEDIYDDYDEFMKEIKKRYGVEKSYTLFERVFLEALFRRYMRGELSDFQVYLFNLYILGLNKLKFEFIQGNNEMGFESFKEKENVKEAITKMRGYSNYDIYLTVLDNYYSEGLVKYIEFRIAPKSSVEDYLRTIDEIDRANDLVYRQHRRFNKNIEKIEYGIIIHYIKCKEEFQYRNGIKRKEESLARLQSNKNILNRFLELKDSRLGEYYGDFEDYDFEMGQNHFMGSSRRRSLADDIKLPMKKAYKGSNYYKSKIVGIDTANYELNFRPEYFGPIYRSHRYLDSSKINLNFTYHVGEDFNTIANGLRAIDEVIEFLAFGRGDRLGHAIALGLDIDDYFTRKRDKLTSSIEDYIDDIAWMYQMISSGDQNHADLLRFLEDEFSKYKNIYLEDSDFQDIDINEYLDAYNLRGDDPDLYIDFINLEDEFDKPLYEIYNYLIWKYESEMNVHNPRHKASFFNDSARRLYFAYNFDGKLKRNGQRLLVFDIDERYKRSVKLCQELLRKKVYELEIKIETNPSSNKKISSIEKFIELPLLNFNQYGLSNKTTKYDIPVSINTDDSAIFQTNLISEYSYLVAAMIREGYNREEIYDYLEYLGRLSLEHSFVNHS